MTDPGSPIANALAEVLEELGPITVAADLAKHAKERRAVLADHVARIAGDAATGELRRFLTAAEDRVARGGDVALFGAAIAAGATHPVTVAAEELRASGRWTKPFLRLLNRPRGAGPRAARETYAGGSTALAVHPDGRLVIAHGNKVSVWTRGEAKPDLAFKTPHEGAIYDLAIHPDGERLFTGCLSDDDAKSPDGRVLAFDLGTGKRVATYAFEAERASFDLSADGKHIAAAGGALRLWEVDAPAKKPIAAKWVIEGEYEVVAFHPSGDTVVAFRNDGKLDIRKVEDGALVKELTPFTKEGINAHVRPRIFKDGRRSIWAFDGLDQFALIDLDTGKNEDWIAGHTNQIESMALSADERRVLTAAQDGTFRIWDYESGECLHAQRVEKRAVGAAAFVDDETRVAAVSLGSDSVTVWDVEPKTPEPQGGVETFRIVATPDGKHLLSREAGRALLWDEQGEVRPLPMRPDASTKPVSPTVDGACWRLFYEADVDALDVGTLAVVATTPSPVADRVDVVDADQRRFVLPGPVDAASLEAAPHQALLQVEDKQVSVHVLDAGVPAARTHRTIGGPPWYGLVTEKGAPRLAMLGEHHLHIWRLVEGEPASTLEYRQGPPNMHLPKYSRTLGAFDSSRERLYFTSLDNVVRSVDVASPARFEPLFTVPSPVLAMRFDAERRALWLETREGCAVFGLDAKSLLAWYVDETPSGKNGPTTVLVLSANRVATLKDASMKLLRLET
jgi:WD40 repeat protein